MKERAKELKAEARANRTRRLGNATCLPRSPRCPNRITPSPSGSMPSLKQARRTSRRRPGMGCPRANKDGKVVCFFQSGQKYDSRYSTFGFQDAANLDDGSFWPTSFALTKLTAADEKRIAALVKRAVS